MRARGETKTLAAALPALAAGLALRALFVWAHPLFLGDTQMYADIAQNLLRHGVYGVTDNGVRPTLIRLPGYPLFLALCFALFGVENYAAVVWVQVALDLAGCVLLWRAAARLFGERTGKWALWLAALCPFTANYTATPLTETGSIFCVSLALWSLVRWIEAERAGKRSLGLASVTGLALAGAVLLRPDGLLLAVVVVPAMAWFAWRTQVRNRSQGWAGATVASAVVLLCLGVWAVRNWTVFHVVQPLAPKYANDPGETPMAGFGRWYRTWAIGYGATMRVYWTYDGAPLSMADLPSRAFDSKAQREETEQLIRRYNVESVATPAIEAAFDRLAQERVRAHPVRYYVLLPAAKLGDMWLRPRTELLKVPLDWWRFDVRPRAATVALVFGLLNLALLGAAVVGVLRWRRAGWCGYGVVAAAGVGFVALRSALLLSIDNSEPRYTLECYPVVLLLAACALRRPDEINEERR